MQEVVGSNPSRTTKIRFLSSAGSVAFPLHGKGRRFESYRNHKIMVLWPSGQAEVCKTSYTGSNPVSTSKMLPQLRWQSTSLVMRMSSVRSRQEALKNGIVPEWSKGAVCKTVMINFIIVGSNPTYTSKICFSSSTGQSTTLVMWMLLVRIQ